jgi:hypothetical protein
MCVISQLLITHNMDSDAMQDGIRRPIQTTVCLFLLRSHQPFLLRNESI